MRLTEHRSDGSLRSIGGFNDDDSDDDHEGQLPPALILGLTATSPIDKYFDGNLFFEELVLSFLAVCKLLL